MVRVNKTGNVHDQRMDVFLEDPSSLLSLAVRGRRVGYYSSAGSSSGHSDATQP